MSKKSSQLKTQTGVATPTLAVAMAFLGASALAAAAGFNFSPSNQKKQYAPTQKVLTDTVRNRAVLQPATKLPADLAVVNVAEGEIRLSEYDLLVTVKNNTAQPVTNPVNVCAYEEYGPSSNQLALRNTISVTGDASHPAFLANETKVIKITVKTTNVHQAMAAKIDCADQLFESDENNNMYWLDQLVSAKFRIDGGKMSDVGVRNLHITNHTNDGNGDHATVTFDVVNYGLNDIDTTDAELFQWSSATQVFTTLMQTQIGKLAPGRQATLTYDLNLPKAVTASNYKLEARVNLSGMVNDFDDANNQVTL